ncbi:Trace amine-associated receptor 2-like protein [Leptotrombidium deliense]|uniref:Trace amine-associated receptor 2-like protein n=1 Tax=Leptotrombidium deliense TaxID=299467 RepID=A0A443SUB6_9ACAR|nr:Trace amine-associated receptor 2-like protein [Leptotrombidium deliense]
MDFCNQNETILMLGPENREGVEYVTVSYSYFCPFLLCACFVSVLLNGLLVIVRRSPLIRKTPIIVMSLNLATTDGLVSLLSVIGITLNSYLPVVYGLTFNSCFLLILEILRLSAFVASVLHLLVLTWLHYQGIVNPLEHRFVNETLIAQISLL